RDPDNTEWQRDLSVSLWKLASFDNSGVDWGDVADALEAMDRNGVLRPVDRQYLDEAWRRAGRSEN
ncbi:MAG: hypothetical protein AAF662_10385, partial [Pseudomonadota bacterium]